jgi:hypothetical protein
MDTNTVFNTKYTSAMLAMTMVLLTGCWGSASGQAQNSLFSPSPDTDSTAQTERAGTVLHGYAQQSNSLTRIQRPERNMPGCTYQGNVSQDSAFVQTPLVNEQNLSYPQSQGLPNSQSCPSNSLAIPGTTLGGQDEYWVDWQGWSNRIGQRIAPMLANKFMWGSGKITYNVTIDRHIQLCRTQGCPSTVKYLVRVVMSLDGDPVLAFPAGTHLQVHPRVTSVAGVGFPKKMHIQQWGPEHIIEEW